MSISTGTESLNGGYFAMYCDAAVRPEIAFSKGRRKKQRMQKNTLNSAEEGDAWELRSLLQHSPTFSLDYHLEECCAGRLGRICRTIIAAG